MFFALALALALAVSLSPLHFLTQTPELANGKKTEPRPRNKKRKEKRKEKKGICSPASAWSKLFLLLFFVGHHHLPLTVTTTPLEVTGRRVALLVRLPGSLVSTLPKTGGDKEGEEAKTPDSFCNVGDASTSSVVYYGM